MARHSEAVYASISRACSHHQPRVSRGEQRMSTHTLWGRSDENHSWLGLP